MADPTLDLNIFDHRRRTIGGISLWSVPTEARLSSKRQAGFRLARRSRSGPHRPHGVGRGRQPATGPRELRTETARARHLRHPVLPPTRFRRTRRISGELCFRHGLGIRRCDTRCRVSRASPPVPKMSGQDEEFVQRCHASVRCRMSQSSSEHARRGLSQDNAHSSGARKITCITRMSGHTHIGIWDSPQDRPGRTTFGMSAPSLLAPQAVHVRG
jgi:hypothetical protein